MTLQRVRLADVPEEAWRNGGGRTRELLALPSRAAWKVRVSVAEIASDGPFSAFPGVERHFAVLAGDGVVLGFPDREVRLGASAPPLRFDGALAPSCRRLGGNVRDLNLMLGGLGGELVAARCGFAWSAEWGWRAVFANAPALVVMPGGETCELEAGELVHGLPPGPLLLERVEPGGLVFWMGATVSGTSGSDPVQ